jgi:hypothetical protein
MPQRAEALASAQSALMDAILRDRSDAIARLAAPAPIAFERALRVHQRTVFGGLANALRLSAPTINWLVGEKFFDQAVRDYARADPPRDADFACFFDGFADFLSAYPLADSAPYLAEVARFDRTLERAGQHKISWGAIAYVLDASTQLSLSASLVVFETPYPVDAIREAFEHADEDALGRLDFAFPRRLAIYRSESGVISRALSQTSALFLGKLLSSGDIAEALETALVALPNAPEDALSAIQSEIFSAPFARIAITQT